MDFGGFQWILVDSNGFQYISMNSRGFQWILSFDSLTECPQWIPVYPAEFQWISLDFICGATEEPLGSH